MRYTEISNKTLSKDFAPLILAAGTDEVFINGINIPTDERMNECENLRRCSFFEIKTMEHKQELALAGFKRIYCCGRRQNQCMRKIVAKVLGPEFIPMNMMPNGLPLTGTDDSEWEPELKAFIRDRFSRL